MLFLIYSYIIVLNESELNKLYKIIYQVIFNTGFLYIGCLCKNFRQNNNETVLTHIRVTRNAVLQFRRYTKQQQMTKIIPFLIYFR